MSELWYAAIFLLALALLLCYRLAKGPHVLDRAVVAESIDTLIVAALVLFSVISGRAIFLDVAIVLALLGFVGEVFIARQVEGEL